MKRERRFDLIISEIGESFTKAVSTFVGSPKYATTLATLLSALVTCRKKRSDVCTGWRSCGVIRTPIDVGMTREYCASERSSMVCLS
jgi:hypothetical protein